MLRWCGEDEGVPVPRGHGQKQDPRQVAALDARWKEVEVTVGPA